jgi:putative membrane protein
MNWTQSLPAFNAFLNSTATVLLIIGYGAIRLRRVRLHKTCMLTALTVSTLFLASYVYYHVAVKGGQSTEFPGQGVARVVYFSVLLSHIFLAAGTVPLALFTAFQALKGRILKHVKIARWTLPIWLYVSITGVVVYWMLYLLYAPH